MARPRLTDKYLENLPDGELLWIGLRPARKQPMTTVDYCRAVAGMGLEGDRRMAGRSGSARQVTLISREFIQCIAQHMAASRPQTSLALADCSIRSIECPRRARHSAAVRPPIPAPTMRA